jgi:tetratricopeptide (TPR) repeat protein
LSIDPKNVPALDSLARLFAENLGQPDKALELAKKAQELQPDDARASDTLGSVLYKRGEYHAALSYLVAATEKEPTEVDYRYHLAMAHYMLGEEDQARLAFRDVIASGNASLAKEEARRRLAFLDIDPATASAAAQTALEARVKNEPNDPVARVRLAAIQARKGGGADAAAGFEATLKLNPRDVSVMLELVRLYSGSLHNPTRARELAKNAHEVAPNDPQISRTLGELLYSNGDYAWSLDLLQQSAKDLQGDFGLTYDLARSYYCTGKVSAAEDALKALAAGGATGPTADRASELSTMISGGKSVAQAQAALPAAQRILATSPNDIPATMVVALAREGQGDIPEARRLYEKMLDEDPLFAPATRQLAHIYSERLEDEPKAYEFATKAHEAFPDDPESDKVLGMLDYRKGDYAGAAHYLQESFRLRNDDGEALYYLGMAHFQLKDMTSSRSELQRAVAMNLPDEEADGAKRTLDQINGPAQGHALSEIPIH